MDGSDRAGDVHPRMMRGRAFRLTLALAAVASLAAGVATSSQGSPAAAPAATPSAAATQPGAPRDLPATARRPNIVFILTDDLSMDLLRYMPHVQAMQRDGLTFNNYFVSDSLCCPSRSSIFTGNFPHDTDVFSNVGRRGGFREFYDRGEEQHTFAVALQNAGYRTAMMGKYLNGYGQQKGSVPGLPYTYVPPGWSEWDVAGWGYREFNYSLNSNGEMQQYGSQPKDYLTDVLARKGVDFINTSAATGQPFFLELAIVRAALSIHARSARRRRLPGAAGSPARQLQQAPDRSARVAGSPPAARRDANPTDRLGVSASRSVRAGRRPDDRADRSGARRQRPQSRHVPGVQLRQRPSHRRIPPDARQDDRIRHRYPRAPGDLRTDDPCRHEHQRDGRERGPGEDVHADRRYQPGR